LSAACRENSPYVGQTALKLLAELIQKTTDKEKLAKTLLPILFDDGLTNSKASVQEESISLVKILAKSTTSNIFHLYRKHLHHEDTRSQVAAVGLKLSSESIISVEPAHEEDLIRCLSLGLRHGDGIVRLETRRAFFSTGDRFPDLRPKLVKLPNTSTKKFLQRYSGEQTWFT